MRPLGVSSSAAMSGGARYSSSIVPEIELSVHADLILREGDGYPTYFASSWPAGEALARYLLDHPEIVRGQRVLDFGTGCGIVAIAAKLAGAAHVRGVDRDPRAVESLARNAEELGLRVEALAADPLVMPLALEDVDLIVAADVFYEDARPSEVGAWLRSQATPTRRVLAADPGRFVEPLPGMRELERISGARGAVCFVYEIEAELAPPSRPPADATTAAEAIELAKALGVELAALDGRTARAESSRARRRRRRRRSRARP